MTTAASPQNTDAYCCGTSGLPSSNTNKIERIETRYGPMFAFTEDDVISRSLRVYGEWAEHEISVLSGFITPGSTVLDVGANIGTHLVALSTRNPSARCFGFEPQYAAAAVATVNCMANDRQNAHILQKACGAENYSLDYSEARSIASNIGAFCLPERATRTRRLLNSFRSSIRRNPTWGLKIDVVRVDDVIDENDVSLIKIDVEGMEGVALQGMSKTIMRHRPTVFCEVLDVESARVISEFFYSKGFNCYWLETHPFNTRNFRETNENIWFRTELGILARHRHLPRADLPPVRDKIDSLPFVLDARAGTAVPDCLRH